MNATDFKLIMRSDEYIRPVDGCPIFYGLKIIIKYMPMAGIAAAEHDVVYSVEADDLVDAGITEDDAIELREHNWFLDDGYLTHYV